MVDGVNYTLYFEIGFIYIYIRINHWDKGLSCRTFSISLLQVTLQVSKLTALTDHARKDFLQSIFRLAQGRRMWFSVSLAALGSEYIHWYVEEYIANSYLYTNSFNHNHPTCKYLVFPAGSDCTFLPS